MFTFLSSVSLYFPLSPSLFTYLSIALLYLHLHIYYLSLLTYLYSLCRFFSLPLSPSRFSISIYPSVSIPPSLSLTISLYIPLSLVYIFLLYLSVSLPLLLSLCLSLPLYVLATLIMRSLCPHVPVMFSVCRMPAKHKLTVEVDKITMRVFMNRGTTVRDLQK